MALPVSPVRCPGPLYTVRYATQVFGRVVLSSCTEEILNSMIVTAHIVTFFYFYLFFLFYVFFFFLFILVCLWLVSDKCHMLSISLFGFTIFLLGRWEAIPICS